ncbi:hypothetical protein DFAR_2410013 [Desulfarculales bacterium]
MGSDHLHRGRGRDFLASLHVGYQERRNSLTFEIDGVVIKIDDLATRQAMGQRSRSPRWAIAWKFPPPPGGDHTARYRSPGGAHRQDHPRGAS